MSRALSQLALRARAGAKALRGFLEGFTGIRSLPGEVRCAEDARRTLGERATRRPTCC